MQSTRQFIAVVCTLLISNYLLSAAPLHQKSPLFDCKSELIHLLRRADQQRDWMNELIDKKEVDLSQLSLSQIKETVKKLEVYKERLMQAKDSGTYFGADEKRYLLLVQELIRQLTNAHLSYEKRMKTSYSVKKIAVPVGAAVAVTGGLLLLGTFVPDIVDVDITTAFVWSCLRELPLVRLPTKVMLLVGLVP